MTQRHQDTPYQIGYAKPPVHTRFRKGQSGNPGGRPKGRRSLLASIDRALTMKVALRENGQVRTVNAVQAVVAALVAKALGGDVKAAKLLLEIAQARESARTVDDNGVQTTGVLVVPAKVTPEEWDALYGPDVQRLK
jgi:hypothetical protein